MPHHTTDQFGGSGVSVSTQPETVSGDSQGAPSAMGWGGETVRWLEELLQHISSVSIEGQAGRGAYACSPLAVTQKPNLSTAAVCQHLYFRDERLPELKMTCGRPKLRLRGVMSDTPQH